MQLNTNLFDISRLFKDFASKYELFECQLLILKTCRHSDPELIENLWKNIIANELENVKYTFPQQVSERKKMFENSFKAIAEQFVHEDEKYFPLCKKFKSFILLFY